MKQVVVVACGARHPWIRPYRPPPKHLISRINSSSSPKPVQDQTQTWITKLSPHAIPISLTSAILFGMISPDIGHWAGKTQIPSLTLSLIFLMTGLQLKLGDASREIRAWKPIIFSLVSILVISPLVFIPVLYQAGSLISSHLHPSLLLGLSVFIAAPTALSSGTQLTSLLGGSVALSIVIVILSNAIACFSLPLLLPLALRGASQYMEGGIGTDPFALLTKLVTCCLIPTMVGASLRASSPMVARLVDGNKTKISLLSTLCLAKLPWIQMSNLSISGRLANLTSQGFISIIFFSVSCRLGLLFFNCFGSFMLRKDDLSTQFKTEELKVAQVVILLSSQRTLPVALAMIASLSIDPSAKGLASLAAVIAHLLFLTIDSLLVSLILNRYGRFDSS